MVVSALVEFLAGDNTRLAFGVGLLAVGLYYRKALGLGSVLQTWAGRATAAAVAIGLLLVLGVIEGIDVQQTVDYARELGALGGDLLADLREVLAA